ncbi:unnamed protein product [Calypogeia fissa]
MEQAKKLRGQMHGYDVQPSMQPPADSPRASPETSESPTEIPETRWAGPYAEQTPLVVQVRDDDPQPTTTPPMDEAVRNPLGCNVEPYGYGTGEFHDLI